MARREGSYHHGSLKQALIEGCLEELTTVSVDKLSLRSLARRLGVSPNAPYRHFADKDALLQACVTHGFELLCERLRSMEVDGAGKRYREAVGRYVAFASENAALYQLMFANLDLGDPASPGKELWAILSDLLRVYLGEVTVTDRVVGSTFAFWSLCHGSAQLENAGFGRLVTSPAERSSADLARYLAKGIRD